MRALCPTHFKGMVFPTWALITYACINNAGVSYSRAEDGWLLEGCGAQQPSEAIISLQVHLCDTIAFRYPFK